MTLRPVVVAVLLAAACSSSGGSHGTTTTTGAGPRQSMQVVDVDGDGHPDAAALVGSDGDLKVVLTTTRCGQVSAPFDSASPVARAVLVDDVDQRGPVEVLLDDGRSLTMLAFLDCKLQPILGADGQPYTFTLGFNDKGTGMGCVDVDGDGRRDLVGLNAVSDDGTTVHWTRTVVVLAGATARNGRTDSGTYRHPADDARIALLHDFTCGDATVARDGLHT